MIQQAGTTMSKHNRHLEGQSLHSPLTPSSSNPSKQKTHWRPKSTGSKENVPPQAVKSPVQSRVKRNLQKFSLNYPLSLPHVEDDSDVEMEIVDQNDSFALHSETSPSKRFSYDGTETESIPSTSPECCVDKKVDIGIQTLLPDHVPKFVEKVLARAIRREIAFEKVCARQNSEIMHLNRMIQQHELEREFNARTSEMWKDQIIRLENLLTTATYSAVSEENNAEHRLDQERLEWAKAESTWMKLVEELRSELQDSRALAEKYEHDLELEKRRLEEAMLAMAHQYVNLEEKHLDLLERNKKIQVGIEEDVKRSPTKELLARMLFKKR